MREKPLEIRQFAIPPCHETPELTPSRGAEIAGDKHGEQYVSNGGLWVHNQGWRGGHTENPGTFMKEALRV